MLKKDYYLLPGKLDSLFFNKPSIPSPIKLRIRNAVDKAGRVDITSVLFVLPLSVSLSGEYEESASNTMGGINTIPILYKALQLI